MGLSCPLGIVRDFPANLLLLSPPLLPYNKSFIDQAYSAKMTGYRPRSFFFLCAKKKKNLVTPAILTLRWVNWLVLCLRDYRPRLLLGP